VNELSRREFAIWAVAAAVLGVACHQPDRPSTRLPTAELGSALRRIRKRVRRHVDDRERRKRALVLIDDAGLTLAELGLLLVQWREATALLPDEQRRDRARVLAITQAYGEEIGAVVHEAGAIAVALRGQIGESEWPLVFPLAKLQGESA
jgi:hypothetical protein